MVAKHGGGYDITEYRNSNEGGELSNGASHNLPHFALEAVIICYTPKNNTPEERKDEYYEELQSVIGKVTHRDMETLISDFNAKVGMDNQGIKNMMGVISFCSWYNLVIGGTFFQLRKILKYTWSSPCGNKKNQIERIAINKERKKNLRNVRSYKGEDIGSDYQFLITPLKLKLKAPNRKVDRMYRFDTTQPLEEVQKETFAIECRNQFAVLETLRDE
ncbi:craniofacial development protein 2-like [Palaemon carinicauda]|uniref:craniofacial development protein 2-like n=1 Tax=Palaemon carinicauda TaxID=392227 RepID=UPI0035B5B558